MITAEEKQLTEKEGYTRGVAIASAAYYLPPEEGGINQEWLLGLEYQPWYDEGWGEDFYATQTYLRIYGHPPKYGMVDLTLPVEFPSEDENELHDLYNQHFLLGWVEGTIIQLTNWGNYELKPFIPQIREIMMFRTHDSPTNREDLIKKLLQAIEQQVG